MVSATGAGNHTSPARPKELILNLAQLSWSGVEEVVKRGIAESNVGEQG